MAHNSFDNCPPIHPSSVLYRASIAANDMLPQFLPERASYIPQNMMLVAGRPTYFRSEGESGP